VVAGAHLAHDCGGHCRHSGGKAASGFGAFQERNALLEHVDGRIGKAPIDVPRRLVEEARLGIGRCRIDEAGIDEHRLGGFPVLAALGAAMDDTGLRRAAAGIGEGVLFLGRHRRTSKKQNRRADAAGSNGRLAFCFLPRTTLPKPFGAM
jgi:hypothetical protein